MNCHFARILRFTFLFAILVLGSRTTHVDAIPQLLISPENETVSMSDHRDWMKQAVGEEVSRIVQIQQVSLTETESEQVMALLLEKYYGGVVHGLDAFVVAPQFAENGTIILPDLRVAFDTGSAADTEVQRQSAFAQSLDTHFDIILLVSSSTEAVGANGTPVVAFLVRFRESVTVDNNRVLRPGTVAYLEMDNTPTYFEPEEGTQIAFTSVRGVEVEELFDAFSHQGVRLEVQSNQGEIVLPVSVTPDEQISTVYTGAHGLSVEPDVIVNRGTQAVNVRQLPLTYSTTSWRLDVGETLRSVSPHEYLAFLTSPAGFPDTLNFEGLFGISEDALPQFLETGTIESDGYQWNIVYWESGDFATYAWIASLPGIEREGGVLSSRVLPIAGLSAVASETSTVLRPVTEVVTLDPTGYRMDYFADRTGLSRSVFAPDPDDSGFITIPETVQIAGRSFPTGYIGRVRMPYVLNFSPSVELSLFIANVQYCGTFNNVRYSAVFCTVIIPSTAIDENNTRYTRILLTDEQNNAEYPSAYNAHISAVGLDRLAASQGETLESSLVFTSISTYTPRENSNRLLELAPGQIVIVGIPSERRTEALVNAVINGTLQPADTHTPENSPYPPDKTVNDTMFYPPVQLIEVDN